MMFCSTNFCENNRLFCRRTLRSSEPWINSNSLLARPNRSDLARMLLLWYWRDPAGLEGDPRYLSAVKLSAENEGNQSDISPLAPGQRIATKESDDGTPTT